MFRQRSLRKDEKTEHRDPFDRMPAAQAKLEDVVSGDARQASDFRQVMGKE
ncbi:MAG: hypothetical protein Q3M24_13755 [Candidatus Electrothrix aestuarii]|uniref:Uncharacterized protein n=1 Tax=Candidatus Electrothrix aestuarii TaxID=3062594 RepID=A0AAU8LQQ5_9BACT